MSVSLTCSDCNLTSSVKNDVYQMCIEVGAWKCPCGQLNSIKTNSAPKTHRTIGTILDMDKAKDWSELTSKTITTDPLTASSLGIDEETYKNYRDMVDTGKRTERHYDQAIQPIDYITANNLDFLHGNVIKYVSRWQGKDGLRDLDKAMDYLQRIIKLAKEGYYGEEYKSPD